MRVAVAGCGIAGTTAAFLLAEAGHEVTAFEQAPRCGPVGAGLLLQPAGQAVLEALGMREAIAARSARIELMHAHRRGGRSLIKLRYGRLRASCHGLGVHRGFLFEALLARCERAGVSVREGVRLDRADQEGDVVMPLDERGEAVGEFDLLVAADGARSRLAAGSGLVVGAHDYPYAAMWTVGPWTGETDALRQILDPSGRLVGVLPVGDGRASFFWGTAPGEAELIRAAGLDAWRRDAIAFEPAAEEILAPLTSLDQVAFGGYRSVRLRRVVDRRTVFIGDAAHAMSPHLGQGTGLALVDALALASALNGTARVDEGLASFARERARQTAFYSALTAALTPFFQTDRRLLRFARDLALPLMPGVPFVGREMLRTLVGEKRGWLG